MDVIHNAEYKKRIKVFLIFFCLATLWQCKKEKSDLKFTLLYEEDRAVALQFEPEVLKGSITIHLKDRTTAILGDFTTIGAELLQFTPVIPFKQNETYTIRYLGVDYPFKTKISPLEAAQPRLLHSYPSCDTVPENLLKMYLVFSQPMQQVGNALDFIKVKNLNTNAYDDIFLSLESELWNKEHTQLTLWLDPGRIKTDLIPNKEKGLPLQAGNRYELIIDERWPDAHGTALGNSYRKKFYVSRRDEQLPKSNNWTIDHPSRDTKEPLTIHFYEPLDALLLPEAIKVLTDSDLVIAGTFELGKHERSLIFTPSNHWKSGDYKLQIAAKLEDLAANNLNSLFDRDLQKTASQSDRRKFFYRSFQIE